MDESFVERMEAVQQELHSAKQQISILNATVSHLTAENTDLQHELSAVLEKEREDKVRLKSTSDMYQCSEDKVSDLNERLQEALQGKEEAEKKLEELTSLHESQKSDSVVSAPIVCACDTEIGTLQLQLEHVQSEMEMKNTRLSEAVLDLQGAMEKNVNLKAEMEELNSELECLQSQMSSQCNVIQCQREELEGLRSQAESSTVCVDMNRKGNSLFSEVEDRRVMAETKMVKTLDKVNKMESRLDKERKENQRLKTQVSLLMRSSNKASDKTVRALEQEVEDSKRQVVTLTRQLAEHKPQATKPTPVELPTSSQPLSGSEVNMVTFLKATVANLQKEREDAIKEKNNLHIQNVQLDFLWTQKKNEVRSLTAEKEKLSNLTNHQALVIESLKSESGSGDGDQQKEMVKITETSADPDEGSTDNNNSHRLHHHNSNIDKNNKENTATTAACKDLKSFILGSKVKSVAFSSEEKDGSVLGDVDSNHLRRRLEEGEEEEKEEVGKEGSVGGGGRNAKSKNGGKQRNGNGGGGGKGGKYSSMTYAKMEDIIQADDDGQAPECNQQ